MIEIQWHHKTVITKLNIAGIGTQYPSTRLEYSYEATNGNNNLRNEQSHSTYHVTRC